MNRFVRIALVSTGILLLILGSYLLTLEYMVQNELSQMNHGLINYSKIREIQSLPFAPEYLLEYNASLAALQSKDTLYATNSLNRILNETEDKEIKFWAYLRLVHLYLDWNPDNQENKQGIGTEYAINMCINALQLIPDDYHTKHLLERLLNQQRIEGKKETQNELRQQLPKDDNIRVWSIIPKGDEY